MAAVTSTPSKGGLQLRLGGRELPVSPPTSPGFDDDEKAKAVSRAIASSTRPPTYPRACAPSPGPHPGRERRLRPVR